MPPTISADDDSRLLRALLNDLEEAGENVVALDGGLRLPGVDDRLVVLGHPLIPGEPGAVEGRARGAEGGLHIVVSQLLVDRALPAALKEASGALAAQGGEFKLPSFLKEAAHGVPLFGLDSFNAPGERHPIARVVAERVPAGAFIVQLTRSTLEARIGAPSVGAWVVFAVADPGRFRGERAGGRAAAPAEAWGGV